MANPDFIPLEGGAPAQGNDFIPLEPTGKEKPLQNRPDDSSVTGTAKNIGTTAIKGLAHIPGFAGDLRELSQYVMQRIHSGITGTPMEELQNRHQEFQRHKADFERRNFGATIPSAAPSGHDIAAPVIEHTGEYQPTTGWGRLGAAAGETGLSMIGPGGLARGLKSGAQGLSAVPQILKGGAKAIPGGAVAGAAGDVATELTGDPLAGMAAGALVPGAAVALKPVVRPMVEPFIPSMRKPAANRRLTEAATDPEAALDALAKRPAKPGETLGEATLDPGILHAEKAALNTSDHFRAALTERDAARAEQRKTQIEGVAPPADQMSPVKLFRQRLQDIDQATQEAVDRAAAQAKAAHQAIPGAKPFDATGESLRNIIAEADKAKGAEVTRLYRAIDPDGNLSLVTSGPREAAAAMHKEFDPTVSEPNTATPIIGKMVNLPEVMPFQKLMKLDKTITAKMKEAALSGDGIGHSQLIDLKGSVQSAIDNAIENQVKWEQGAVARGELHNDDTTYGRLLQTDISKWYADRNAGADTRALAGGDAGARPTVVSGGPRAPIQGRGQPAASPGDQGVPGNVPNFDEGAASRLATAKEGHAERAQTFRQGPVAPTLKTTGFAGQYATPAAKVPAAAFPKGDTGYSNARAFLKAAGDSPDALSGLQDIAVSRLREAMPEGELAPKALAKWKQDYGPALRAIDEKVPGFSDRFSDAAKATDALEQATLHRKDALAEGQKGAAAKFMNLTNPAEVGDTMMSMVKARNGPTQIRDLFDTMWQTGSDVSPIDAINGVRHSLTQAILRDHKNADGMLSGAKLRNFIADNQPALQAVYGKNGAEVLTKLAEDSERYQQAVGIQSSKLGSDTASNLFRMIKERGADHLANFSIAAAFANGLFEAVTHGEPGVVLAAAGLGAAKLAVAKLRANGVHKINDLVALGLENPEVGAAMMQSALDAKGNLKVDALEALAKTVARASAEKQTLQEHSRIGRASGGKVDVDHAALARKLIGLAQQAKKDHAQRTQKLLKVPDANITQALRLANEATQ